MKKTFVITGTEGFIGANLLNTLKEKYPDGLFLTINEDIFEDENWDLMLETILHNYKPDAVFHIGACSDTLEKNVNYMMKVNYEFTFKLAELCKDLSIPIIYSSSAANYGVNDKYPSNLYGWSKYAAEGIVTALGGIGLRYFNVYGPGEEHKGRMASVAYQMYLKSQDNQEIKLFPKKPLRDFVFIKDIVSANLYAYENYSKLNSNWYEVGSGEARSFEDMIDNMGYEYTYHPESIIPEGYQFFTCSSSNLWMEGWQPQYTLESGIKEYLEYLLPNK